MRPRLDMRDLYRRRSSSVGSLLGLAIRLLMICVAVGLVMAFLGITPRSLIADTLGSLREAWEIVLRLFHWALPYALLGASVVIPIAVVVFALRLIRR